MSLSKFQLFLISEGLSIRTAQILDAFLINPHWRNKEVAAFFNIEEQTVKYHLAKALRKYEAKNRVQLQAKIKGDFLKWTAQSK